MIRTHDRSTWLLALAVALAGCADPGEDADTGGTASSTGEPDSTGAPACVEDDLAPDPFAGPGWDGELGALKEPLQDEYVASTTALVLRPAKEQEFFATAKAMFPVLEANPGLIGYALAQSKKCGTVRTLAVWRDEAAMMQFVVSDEHVAGILKVNDYSTAGVVTSWKLPRAELPVTWEVAIARATAAAQSY
ncbi:Heme-degrading monooxygenase HmoA [Nannocystis exedens]|uniref:Heme-degrading monooxygenase HmoA n=1 Tax=Nannocystis exedens TaxID=54 RepID=A0A1I2CAZ2_9BACT|nr:antibiotic biosynthesis monooxygenase [Nannocystis exedens]PCC68408.1 Antibiotic biosynthesis monooxygenase [Nannocystis exedens]SFE65509.1 Heme-degrading monooxygenase HmoA [Nannocystis exedens]